MRVLHISDLHLGRDLSGVSRRAEQERLVLELSGIARDEAIGLTIVSGDVFDTANPPAWAEDAFFALLDGLAEGGRRAVVVVAGNHDHAVRLAAAEPLARRLGIVLLGGHLDIPSEFHGVGVRIEPLGQGAARIESAGSAIGVGALPFVAEAAVVRRTGAVAAEPNDREAYGRELRRLLSERRTLLPEGLPTLLAAHLWVTGAVNSPSERIYRMGHLSDLPAEWVPQADYVALGHLHRPQEIVRAGTPLVYAGSPIAYSLAEAGQQKRAVVVELQAGKAARFREVALTSGRSVETWFVRDLGNLRERAQRSPGSIVGLSIDLGRPLERRELEAIHELGPAFVSIDDLAAPDAEGSIEAAGAEDLPDEELVRAFIEAQGHDDPALVEALLEMLREGESPPTPAREAA